MINRILFMIMWSLTKRSKRADIIRKQGVEIGSGCEIYRDVYFGSEPYLIKIGNNVRLTSGVKFCTHDGGIWTLRKMKLAENADIFGKIEIGNNVHIGWNTIIMPNVKIGNNCIIGCGAVVTKNIPDNSIAVGVPAKIIKTVDEYCNCNNEKMVFTANLSGIEKQKAVLEKMR